MKKYTADLIHTGDENTCVATLTENGWDLDYNHPGFTTLGNLCDALAEADIPPNHYVTVNCYYKQPERKHNDQA